MALRIWLPFDGDLNNYGLDNITVATNTGAVVSNSGKIGKCYSFDGVDDWTQFTVDKYTFGGKPISMAYWFLSDKVKSNGTVLCLAADLTAAYRYNASSDTVQFAYWRVYANSSGGRVGDTNYEAPLYDANVWHHIVCVFEKTKNYIYVDGELAGEWNSKGKDYWVPMLASSYNKFSVGKSAGSATWTGGLINDVRLYDHALSLKEIKELAKGPMLHLKLDNSGFGNENLIPDSVYSEDPWKTATVEELELDGKWAKLTWVNTLYNKTSSGTEALFPGVTFEENTQYTISIDWRDDYRTDNKITGMYLVFKYSDGTANSINAGDLRGKHYWTHRSFTSTAGKTVSNITTTYSSGSAMYLANIKLEKGAVDTGYAPTGSNPVYDSSGYDKSVEAVGVITPASGSPRYGKWLYFQSDDPTHNTSGQAFVKSNISLTNPTQITVAWWAKPESGYSSSSTLSVQNGAFAFSNSSYPADYTTAAMNHYDGNIRINDTQGTSHLNLALNYIKNETHHYAVTYDGIAATLYRDGVQIETESFESARALGSATDLYVGFSNAGSVIRKVLGYYSDFRVYATALSADDILDLYHATASADRSGNLYVREAVEV